MENGHSELPCSRISRHVGPHVIQNKCEYTDSTGCLRLELPSLWTINYDRIPGLLNTSQHSVTLLLIYLPRNDERLSRPGWLTYSGRFTHIGGHPSAAGRAQDRESSPDRDRRSTTVPRSQLIPHKLYSSRGHGNTAKFARIIKVGADPRLRVTPGDG